MGGRALCAHGGRRARGWFRDVHLPHMLPPVSLSCLSPPTHPLPFLSASFHLAGASWARRPRPRVNGGSAHGPRCGAVALIPAWWPHEAGPCPPRPFLTHGARGATALLRYCHRGRLPICGRPILAHRPPVCGQPIRACPSAQAALHPRAGCSGRARYAGGWVEWTEVKWSRALAHLGRARAPFRELRTFHASPLMACPTSAPVPLAFAHARLSLA